MHKISLGEALFYIMGFYVFSEFSKGESSVSSVKVRVIVCFVDIC